MARALQGYHSYWSSGEAFYCPIVCMWGLCAGECVACGQGNYIKHEFSVDIGKLK